MDERTLCTRLKAWIDAELRTRRYADLTHSDTEVHAAGGLPRHDLAIYAGAELAFTLEVRTPTHPHGSSPYDAELLGNARAKADTEGLSYFGTFNCASFVLWKVHDPGVPIPRRYVRRWKVVPSHLLGRLDSPGVEKVICDFLPKLFAELAAIRHGIRPAPGLAPEDEIVDLVEDRLNTIVGLTFPGVRDKFESDSAFRRNLKRWMIRDQQWTWDDTRADDLILRATQIGCYLVMNQLLFYETMRRRFAELAQIDLSAATSGRGIEERLQPRFVAAMRISRDYETVFGVGWISSLAFVADGAVRAWAALAHGVRDVDLAGVSLDLLGGIFERLLSPEERHQFGQHYTSPELADLLLAATVRHPDAVVFDPASGGGTFLVRAYSRKKHLGQRDHVALLSDIYGVDISPFAAHLSVLNLAVRSLEPEENYPRIGTKDFLSLEPGAALTTMPDVGGGARSLPLPQRVNVVIGNPPYVRRQNIQDWQWATIRRALRAYPHPRPVVHELSDLHTYFWIHGTRFVGNGDFLAFLSSSSWLENTSGFSLRRFLLANYDILLVAESDVEPWFSGARVRTVATVLRRRNVESRTSNTVTFAHFRKPLAAAFGPRTDAARWERVEQALQALLDGTSEDARIWQVPQEELPANAAWSFYLRVPDLLVDWRQLEGVVPLGKALDISVGPKLGGTDFFKLEDITDRVLTDTAEVRRYGITPESLRGPRPRYRIVYGLDGWTGPIETKYLRRTVRSPKHERTRVLHPSSCDICLFVPRADDIRGKKVAVYIAHGDRAGVGRRVYAGARNPWYSIEEKPRGPIIYPHAFQFGHKVWLNPQSAHYTTSPNTYLIPREFPSELAAAVMNSTWVYLDAVYTAGAVGVEGNTRFGGLSQWERLHVPLLTRATEHQCERLAELWQRMRDEAVTDFPPAGDAVLSGWRRELDELVIQIAGVEDSVEASEWVDRLYRWIRDYVSQREDVESQAVAARTGEGSGPSLRRVAEQTVAAMTTGLTPPWLDRVDAVWPRIELPSERVISTPQQPLFGRDGEVHDPRDVQFGETWIRLESSAQAEFLRILATSHLAPSPCPVPPVGHDADIAMLAAEFATSFPALVKETLRERLDEVDPSFDETYALALSLAAARCRELVAERAGIADTSDVNRRPSTTERSGKPRRLTRESPAARRRRPR
jgi:hypothetical protein